MPALNILADRTKVIIGYHCKCEKCGKLIHLHCHEVEELSQHMMEHHSFELNAMRTVFYGVCSECRQKEAGCTE